MIKKRNAIEVYDVVQKKVINRQLKRGDIIGVNLGKEHGFATSGIRPAIVVSNMHINLSSSNIIIVPLSKISNKVNDNGEINISRGQFVLSNKFYRQLKYTSVVKTSDVRPYPMSDVTEYIGKLSQKSLDELDEQLKHSLGIC